jgi:hypothetical protein
MNRLKISNRLTAFDLLFFCIPQVPNLRNLGGGGIPFLFDTLQQLLTVFRVETWDGTCTHCRNDAKSASLLCYNWNFRNPENAKKYHGQIVTEGFSSEILKNEEALFKV